MKAKQRTQDKLNFGVMVQSTMRAMGLKVLESKADYADVKPDLVAVYEDKKKYYMIEVLSEGCLMRPSPRLYTKDQFEDYRIYCKKLFADNELHAAIAAAVICDMAYGVELFKYKSLGSYQLHFMSRYAGLAVPQEFVKDTGHVLEKLTIEYGTLDILDKFTLVLISKEFTEKLSETKRFIQFILSNK